MQTDADFVDAINAILPQTQCKQCGYEGCLPYAQAIVAGEAHINQCPPGGEDVIHELADLLHRPFTALDPKYGGTKLRSRAFIHESLCIGCTLCIRACPVEAIVGALKHMHTVIAAHCTGCELCVPPCPVDCIEMITLSEPFTRADRKRTAGHALARFHAHQQRLERECTASTNKASTASDRDHKTETVNRAMERARIRIKQRLEKS